MAKSGDLPGKGQVCGILGVNGMNVLIFGGFLGSGKTTSLMQLARFVAESSRSDNPNKVMIIENEIGQVGIDDAFLRSGGFRVDNLFAGCACCTISGELTTAILRIRKQYDPEWVIVETTGLAYPKRIQENLLETLQSKARIAVLVDASRWRRLHKPMESLFRGQIEGADAVIINKTDLVTEEVLQSVEQDILEYDGNVALYRISALEPVSETVWKGVLGYA